MRHCFLVPNDPLIELLEAGIILGGRMAESNKGADLKEILRDPTRMFRQPEEVLLHPELDREAKIAILRWWERHERDALARESRKPDGESLRLTGIIRALNALLHDRSLDGQTKKSDGSES